MNLMLVRDSLNGVRSCPIDGFRRTVQVFPAAKSEIQKTAPNCMF
jgi:hypothetical protein